jgi:hypothetical protein
VSRYEMFDRSRLCLRPLAERASDLSHEACLPLGGAVGAFEPPGFRALIAALDRARRAGRPLIWMIGAHVIKLGLSRFLIDLMERGWVTHLATNGAGVIHDYELALHGGTSENVARYIRQGEFGLWAETGRINDVAREAAARGEGLGEALGRVIVAERMPHRDLSIAAAGWRCGVPVTAHVSIGCDIIHQHPNCDGAAWGAASYSDFLILARAIEQLEAGVYLNIGSAVTGPEVYLKALSMARNVARSQGRSVAQFVTAVFDLVPLPGDFRQGTPPKTEPAYYYRPWKTILVRTVADGGTSFYFQGDHQVTIPNLHAALCREAGSVRAVA